MKKITLTDASIRSLQPGSERFNIADTLVPGLSVRVTPTGQKNFMLLARWGGAKQPATRTLGSFPAMKLADARTKAREWLTLRSEGKDPAEELRKAQEAAAVAQGNTFGAVMADYLTKQVRGQRKAEQTEREMRRELLPPLGTRPINEITRRELVALVEAIVARGSPYQAHNIWGHARSLFNWAIDSDVGIEVSPCWPKKPRCLLSKEAAKKPRQRVLTDREIVAFWNACDRMSFHYGELFRLLLLTGARKSEIGELSWSEVDMAAGLITIPPERFKSDTVHLIPLTDQALSILASIPRGSSGGYVFSTTDGEKPLNGYGTAKRLLDNAMSKVLGERVAPFVIHDVRRTVRTRLGALKVADHVSELVIGHARQGLAGVYDRHAYLDERKEALQLWNASLGRLINPNAKVISLRR